MKTIRTLLLFLFALPTIAGQTQQPTSPDQVPAGLAKSDWQSIHEAHAAWKHRFHAVEGGWLAHNPGQQWSTRFDGRGFLATPKDADWTWGLELQSYGYGRKQSRFHDTPVARAVGQRLAYRWSESVEEWFVNDSRGLEHGFTITKRPEGGSKSEPLVVTLATMGPLQPTASTACQTVHFRDAAGAPVLNYSGLKVWDATGKIMPSRFQVVDREVRLLVEEYAAQYPLTIDPIAQQAYIKTSNTGAGDQFGISVAVSGDTVVVGANGEDSSTTGVNSTPNESASSSGAAYVFVRSGSTWSQQAYLKASNSGANDTFGISVAVSGDTVVVGGQQEDSSTTGVNSTPNESAGASGAAYVFTRSGGVWSQQAYLKASNTGASDAFGLSVAVSGDTVVVGAMQEDSSTTGVNSAPNESATTSGAAYVFVRSGSTWSQQAYLKASNSGINDSFGVSVAVSGDTAVVGADEEGSSTTGVNGDQTNNSANASGAAYVFTRSGSIWSQQAYLKASNTGTGDEFGSEVAVSGDTVVIGAILEDSSTTGVNSTPNESAGDSGAAYVFVRSGSTWSQQAYLKASNTGASDYFGLSVAVSGDTVVIGAGEDSSTTGVNSTPNESASNSGAAYVFTRNGSIWSQQAYLKASNTGAIDGFGYSVAVSGDTAVVGAYGEDSSTTGVDTTPDEGAANSGATYIFTGLGPPPLLSSVSPAFGSTSGGTALTISGANLSGATSVLIGGVPVTSFTVESASTIIATTPAHSAGTVDIEVSNSVGTVTGSGMFTYMAPDIAVSQSGPLTDGTGTVEFGSVLLGGSGISLNFTIHNPGPVALGNLAVSKDGPDVADFTLGALSATQIPPGGSANFNVTFAPAIAGFKSAAIHIASDAPGSKNPFDIAISGTGNTPPTFSGYSVSTAWQTPVTVSQGKLLANAADADGHALSVTAAGPASAQGGTAVLGSGILYTPPAGFSGTDTFPVTLADALGATVNGTVTVTVGAAPGSGGGFTLNPPQVTVQPNGKPKIAFQGIPGRTYRVERSTNMSTWSNLANVTASPTGSVEYIDESPPPGSAFYRIATF